MNTTDADTSRTDARPSEVIVPPLNSAAAGVSGRTAALQSTADIYYQFDRLNLAIDRLRARSSRSQAPLRILVSRRSVRDHVRQAQRLLLELGYDPGQPDGLVGKQTVAAIKAFQHEHELAVTGYPNPRFYSELNRAAGREPQSHAVIRIRQNAKEIYSAAIGLEQPDIPIGSHLYTLAQLDSAAGEATWHGMTIKSRGRLGKRSGRPAASGSEAPPQTQPVTMAQALDRIAIPRHVRMRISDLLTSGSSLIITDGGYTRETGIDTDFIVLTR